MWRTIFGFILFALAATALAAQQVAPPVPPYEPQKQERLSGGTVGAHLTLKDSAGG